MSLSSKPNPERISISLTGNWASSKTLKDLLSIYFCNRITSQRTEGRPICHLQQGLDNPLEFQGVTFQRQVVLESSRRDNAVPECRASHGILQYQSLYDFEVMTYHPLILIMSLY